MALRWHRQALDDLRGIHDYIANENSVAAQQLISTYASRHDCCRSIRKSADRGDSGNARVGGLSGTRCGYRNPARRPYLSPLAGPVAGSPMTGYAGVEQALQSRPAARDLAVTPSSS